MIVTKEKVITLAAILAVSSSVLMACNPPKNGTDRTQASNQITVQTSQTPNNGSIASIELEKLYSVAGEREYKVFYWSNNEKVEAFVIEPSNPGHYPLFVNLHGGYMEPTDLQKSSEFAYTDSAAYNAYVPNTVTVFPEYQGYMDSQGYVMGLKTDFQNVQDAITAAKSLHEVAPNDTYVIGYSLGGGLALMTASDPDVKAVVAVSPFVGLNQYVSWASQNAKPGTLWYNELKAMEAVYGSQVNSEAFNERSPNFETIHSPVLLLQGTGDKEVAWQSVQDFYQQMKSANKVVKFVLYPGGQHGLHGQYSAQSTEEIDAWFQKYGLSNSYSN